MENQTQSINTSNEVTMNKEELIVNLFNLFLENGGEPKVTQFKKHLDSLITDNIKTLARSSKKSPDGSDWRTELKSKFSGRGAKWVFVSLEEIESTLLRLESEDVDCSSYRKYITEHNKAWIRFNGPRINNNQQTAAFEVRTDGSTIDSPKQLHYISLENLDNTITAMGNTPKSLKLEESSKPKPNNKAILKPKADEPKEETPKEETIETQPSAPTIDDLANEINNELSEPPQSDDPADWEAFLAQEGLSIDEFSDDYELEASHL